ncbi:unnamed protein product [Chrysoparadoxa australica]
MGKRKRITFLPNMVRVQGLRVERMHRRRGILAGLIGALLSLEAASLTLIAPRPLPFASPENHHQQQRRVSALPPLHFHPGAGPSGFEEVDEATYAARWRESRIEEMLGMGELDPGSVNEILTPDHLMRHRIRLQPDEAFGCIFQLDVLCNVVPGLVAPVWEKVAEEYKMPPVSPSEIQRSLGELPELAILRFFRWSNDIAEAKKYVLAFALYIEELKATYKGKLNPGVEGFLKNLVSAGIPIAVTSNLPLEIVESTLSSAGIADMVDARIAAEDVHERDMTGFLKAALKLNKPPIRCLVFDCRPQGIIQAHDAGMRAVATVDVYPFYELNVADITVRFLEELTLINVRGVFADPNEMERRMEMQPELQVETRPKRKLRTKTRQEEMME